MEHSYIERRNQICSFCWRQSKSHYKNYKPDCLKREFNFQHLLWLGGPCQLHLESYSLWAALRTLINSATARKRVSQAIWDQQFIVLGNCAYYYTWGHAEFLIDIFCCKQCNHQRATLLESERLDVGKIFFNKCVKISLQRMWRSDPCSFFRLWTMLPIFYNFSVCVT